MSSTNSNIIVGSRVHRKSTSGNTSIMNAVNTNMNNNINKKYLDLSFFKSQGLNKNYPILSEYPISTLKLKTTEEFMQIGLTIGTIKELRKTIDQLDTPPNHQLQILSPNDTDSSCVQAPTATASIATTTATTTTTVIGSSQTDNTISPRTHCKESDTEAANTLPLNNRDYLKNKGKPLIEKPNNSNNAEQPDFLTKFSIKKRKEFSKKKTEKYSKDTSITTVIDSSQTDNTISSITPFKESDTEAANTSTLNNRDYLLNKGKPLNEEPNNSHNSEYPDLMTKFSIKKRKEFINKKNGNYFNDSINTLELEFAFRKNYQIMASYSDIERYRNIIFWKLDEEELKDHFVAGACTECHKIPSTHDHMKACSQCCLVWYCGKDCQKDHWKYHKEFCKATKAVAKDFNYSYIMEGAKNAKLSGVDFAGFFLSMQFRVAEKLNRDLDALETNILINPKVCEICKEADPAGLKPCKICYGAFYCSKKHANQDYVRHSTLCPGFLLALQCYNLITTKGLPIPRNIRNVHYKTAIAREYKPITGTMTNYIRPTFEAVDTFVSDFISYPLSLIYALERTGLKNGTDSISRMKELTILMCDPCNGTHKTMCHNFMWEYMFHLLPKLKNLNLILCELTPQSKCSCPVQYHPCKPLDDRLCYKCRLRDCNFSVHSIDDYHKYKLSKEFKKPDVIYNHLVTDLSLKELLSDLPCADPEVPLVLVDRSKEVMQASLQVMREKEEFEMILPLQVNPFAGIQPSKIHDRPLLYTNCYIVGLRRQSIGNSK